MATKTSIGAAHASDGKNMPGRAASELTRRGLLVLSTLGIVATERGTALAANPEGQLTWAVHVSGADVVRPGGDARDNHALHAALRAA